MWLILLVFSSRVRICVGGGKGIRVGVSVFFFFFCVCVFQCVCVIVCILSACICLCVDEHIRVCVCQWTFTHATRLNARTVHPPSVQVAPSCIACNINLALPPPPPATAVQYPPAAQTPKFRFVSSRKGVTSARQNGVARTFHFTPPFFLEVVNVASALFPPAHKR